MRGIVIGGLGVDRPRELCARASPELPVDRNADLQALPIGQDRFPPSTVASAYALLILILQYRSVTFFVPLGQS